MYTKWENANNVKVKEPENTDILIINVALNIQSVILCILKERFSNLWSSDLINYTAAVWLNIKNSSDVYTYTVP